MSSFSSPQRRTFVITECALEGPYFSLSEEASHREHCAALDATVFRRDGKVEEVVFELEDGCLRLQGRRR
jgi:hypothetical protein